MANDWDWLAYYDAVQGKPPRETLLKALDLFDKQPLSPTTRLAIDLGCGSGRDTFELLRRNWQVYAIDSSQTAISYLLNHSDLSFNLLKTQITRFEDLTLPSPTDLVNASFSLPFCSPKYFPDFWNQITASLRFGGPECGQLFGDRDSWSTNNSMTFHALEKTCSNLPSPGRRAAAPRMWLGGFD
ncbi:MAG: class I SAM-dependent methyltransferase [Mastigocoleus sp. MO_167.B18]|nr:class I SAM-dependent methyltransferase [Mastigocoleus sp. MO_167.B18]